MKCPKCKSTSGNDWSQCGNTCPMPASPHYINRKLTKWDAGNVLVNVADVLGEAIEDLKDFPKERGELIQVRSAVSSIFKINGYEKEMGFGI